MLNKFTFGNTPAAIYLADRLNTLDDAKYTRKISARIHEVQTLMAEVKNAHEYGALSIHTVGFFANRIRTKIVETANILKAELLRETKSGHQTPDLLCIDLMSNILIGEVKSITRRSREVVLMQKKQQRALTDVSRRDYIKTPGGDVIAIVNVIPRKIQMSSFQDCTTPATLVAKSCKKLKRLGVKNTFY